MRKTPIRTALAAAALAAVLLAPGLARAEKAFDSPQAAVEALIAALEARDRDAVLEIFGEDSEDLVSTGVPEVDRRNWTDFVRAWKAAARVVVREDEAELFVGPEQWPFPVTLARGAAGWFFDTAAARDEILYRRIGRNELTAIGIARAFVRAQFEYFTRDRDGDGVLEFAQAILSAKGARDGLYWPVEEAEEESPFGPAIAAAAARGYDLGDGRPAAREPYEGYYFKVLTRQGEDAPGGAFDYVVNGNMVAGFGLLAWPADYGVSGVMSFMMGRNGDLYERDLGTATDALAPEIDAFDPTPGWTRVDGESG